MLKALGGDNFEVLYTGIKKRQRGGARSHFVPVEMDAYKAARDRWIKREGWSEWNILRIAEEFNATFLVFYQWPF